jgi:hypothetical protein
MAAFVDISRRKRLEQEKDRLVQKLQAALEKVKTLRGLIPICAGCKKIRNDKGFWQQVEAYFEDHSEVEFSHGLCPECIERLYPELKGTGSDATASDSEPKPPAGGVRQARKDEMP